MNRMLAGFALSVSILLTPAWAQPPEQSPPPEPAAATQSMPMQQGDQPQDMGGMGSMPMQSMAESMKAMADMCRHMMEREMAMRPYKMAAGALFGLLLLAVLILLVVLQVQWIIYWRRRLSAAQES